MEYQVTPKKMYRYWLTEKGKRIAKKLDEIEDILNEE
jgi:predicted transcriptional regulator